MNAPRLRFKEFGREWEVKKLGAETTWNSGGTPSKQTDSYWNGDIPWISASSMRDFKYFDSDLKITEAGLLNGSKLASKGALLLLVRGSMLFNKIPVGIATKEVAFNQDVKSITTKESIKPEFLLYWFLASENKLLNMVSGTGIGAGKLDTQDLLAMDLCIPALPEQTKIANFLTAIDEKITQLTQKYDLLKQYKKGVMQQIFSQKLRFKDDDGREFPEWEEKQLGDISRNIMYGMNAAAIPFDGKNKYIRITDIDDESRSFKPSPLSSPSGNIETKFKMQIGDIVFARTGASVGKSYLYNSEDGNLFFAGFLVKFSISEGNPYFIFLQTLTESYRSWVKVMSMRSGQPGINAEEYKDFEIIFPCLAEQTKIANFLTAIDEKITRTQAQLDAVKLYKKGLLQQLFV